LKIYVSHGSVATQLKCGELLTTTLLPIVHSMCQWKNFENRSIFGKDVENDIVTISGTFFWDTV